jgi:hypothetical protein
MESHQDSAEPQPIESRTDTGGAWAAAGPLVALGLIGLMLVQSCLPSTGTPSAPARTTAPR